MENQSKAKTLQERFGFKDPELSTPRHDQIMLWLDEQAEDVAATFTGRVWPEKMITCFRTEAEKVMGKLWEGLGNPPDRPSPTVTSKVWEYPIKNGNYLIGFVDMALFLRCPQLDVIGIERSEHREPRRVHGDTPRWGVAPGRASAQPSLLLEVKPEIRSVGEVVRQIRMYQAYQDSLFVVVCPDDRFREVLRGQGIGFVKSPV